MSSEQPTVRAAATGLPCPVCKVDLVMTSREGVEIDYCPTCRGVWLDRGELDKIIERNLGDGAGAAPPADASYGQPASRPSGYDQENSGIRGDSYGMDGYGRRGGHGGHGQGGHGQGGHGRGHGGRGSFLSRLFD